MPTQPATGATALNTSSALYPFVKGCWPFNEGSGSAAAELRSAANGAEDSPGALTWSTPGTPVAVAADFDGSTYVTAACAADAYATANYTVCFWFKPASVSGNQRVVCYDDFDAGKRFWSARLNGAVLELLAFDDGGSLHTVTAGPVAAGTWYFAKVSYDGATLRASLNNGTPGTTSEAFTSRTAGAARVRFGASNFDTPSEFFTGSLAVPVVFSAALGDATTAPLYDGTTDLFDAGIAAGTAAFVSSGPGGIAVSATAPSGGAGSGPAYQWERAAGGSYADVTGATSLGLTDATALTGVLYTYRCKQTRGATTVTTAATAPAQKYAGGPIGAALVALPNPHLGRSYR